MEKQETDAEKLEYKGIHQAIAELQTLVKHIQRKYNDLKFVLHFVLHSFILLWKICLLVKTLYI